MSEGISHLSARTPNIVCDILCTVYLYLTVRASECIWRSRRLLHQAVIRGIGAAQRRAVVMIGTSWPQREVGSTLIDSLMSSSNNMPNIHSPGKHHS